MRLYTWNVNGFRAVLQKGFGEWFQKSQPDIVCLQETKAMASQIPPLPWAKGYEIHWNPAKKPGYSGTGLITRIQPRRVSFGMDHPEHDNEGRLITAEFESFYLVNVYVPNVRHGLVRMDYRKTWDRDLLGYLLKLEKDKPVLFCGDLNVAHEAIDLARPKENVGNPGFTDEERSGFRGFLEAGFVDSFRTLEPGGGHYTWWTYRAGARARNIGWRIDYWMVSSSLQNRIRRVRIEPEVHGSDHCPVLLELT